MRGRTCHSPISNVQPFVDSSVEPSGKTPQVCRGSWETAEFEMLLRNAPLSVIEDHVLSGQEAS